MKRCSQCKELKEESEFYTRRDRNCLQSYCKRCAITQSSNYQNKTKYRAFLKSTYGITPEDYDGLYDKQKGKCAICGKHQSELKRRLCVDHDHNTGKVRGLLCHKCNFVIGNADDDIEILNKAITYLSSR